MPGERSLKRLAGLASGLVAALTALLVCVPLQVFLPRIAGPDFLLLRYSNELVAIDLVGAVIPLFVCGISILAVSSSNFYRETNNRDRRAFKEPGFWLGVLAIALASTTGSR